MFRQTRTQVLDDQCTTSADYLELERSSILDCFTYRGGRNVTTDARILDSCLPMVQKLCRLLFNQRCKRL